jgi:hypothetical protein
MKIVIAGMGGGFFGLPGWEDAEWWQCKQGYMLQPRIDRIYNMDKWADMVTVGNDPQPIIEAYRKLDVSVVLLEKHPDIPKSEAYPLEDVRKYFFGDGRAWLASTISYMLADAIQRGATEILLWKILEDVTAGDYWLQKANLDLLFGYGMGEGVTFSVTNGSQIGKPYPWQPWLYGYDDRILNNPRDKIIATAMAACMELETSDGEHN